MTTPDSSQPLVGLLTRAREGDAAARDAIFDKCRNYVRVIANTQVEGWMRAKVDASDLVQQTLLEAHRGFDNFRGNTEAEWLGWLKTILSHNTQDFIRRYKGTAKRQANREVRLHQGSPNMSNSFQIDPSAHIETPSQLMMQREREVLVADAISKLPEDYQDVIMLRNLQRLPFDEIALRMERSRSATQMLWMRALKKLKEELGADNSQLMT